MAIINGPRLIQGVLQELGVTTLSPLVQGALGARLQQAIEAGSASNFQLAAVLASNPIINAATPAGQSPGAFVASTVNRVREALSNAATEVQVADLQSYDASSGAFNFILDFTTAGVKLANLDGFGADDIITVRNAPVGATLDLDSSAADQLDLAYGDLDIFSNAWVVTLLNQDPQQVADVVAAEPDTAAQVAQLTAAFGGDWLQGANIPEPVVQTTVQVADLQSYDASSDAFNFILDFSVAGVKLAEIAGFGADDTLTVTNAPADFSLALDSSAPDSLDFAYGDLEGFSNAWGITLLEQDPQLVEALNSSAGDPVAQIGILTSTYGEGWLNGIANA